MHSVGRTALLVALLAAGGFAQDGGQAIKWSRDLNATLARARKENRPILIAINALDTERGNEVMRLRGYRDKRLVQALRPMLCLVANPNNHDRGGTCSRYGSTDCKTHRDVLTYALRRWSNAGDIISPQHMILAPDGTLLWRKEFLIPAATLQRECELALVKSAPARALELAGQTRERAMQSLARGADPGAFLKLGDPLGPAVLLLMWEEDEDPKWLAALKTAPKEAFGLVRLYLPEPAFLPVAKAIDPKRGAWWQRRINGKPAKPPPPHDPKLRGAFVALKKGDKSGLEALLAALDHPVDGPEVRAAFAALAGIDHGWEPVAWREQFGK